MGLLFGTWEKFTGKSDSVATETKSIATKFELQAKSLEDKKVLLVMGTKKIAVITKGIAKVNDDYSELKTPRHRIKLCKGVKVEEIPFWSKFVEWVNLNITTDILEKKGVQIVVVS